jgi:hypothetical protein
MRDEMNKQIMLLSVCKGERMEKAIETVGNTKHEGSVSGTVRR